MTAISTTTSPHSIAAHLRAMADALERLQKEFRDPVAFCDDVYCLRHAAVELDRLQATVKLT